MSRRAIAVVGLVLAGAGAGLWWGGAGDAAASAAPRALPVRVTAVRAAGRYAVERACAGRFRALRQGALGFERGGRLLQVHVREGDAVPADAPLAALDPAHLEAQRRELVAALSRERAVLAEREAGPREEQVAAARSDVRDLEIQRDLAQRQLQRLEGMVRDGIAPQEDLDQRRAERDSLEARLETARHRLEELVRGTRAEQIAAQRAEVELLEARLASLDLDRERSVLRAPYAGTITALRVHEGAVVEAGQAVLELLEDRAPELYVGVPPEVAAGLAVGERHPVQCGAGTVEGRIREVLPEVDPATRTRTVILEVPSGAARAGEAARLLLREERDTDGFWLPWSALTRGGRGLWSCLGVAPDTQGVPTVVRHSLEVLHVEAERVLVRGTLREGDRVLAGGTERVVVGQPVEPLAEDQP